MKDELTNLSFLLLDSKSGETSKSGKVGRGMIKNFEDLKIWQRADELFDMVYEDVKKFPKDYASRIIIDQVLRSISSISANIAEGCGRGRNKEFRRFLVLARGSLVESQNWILKAHKRKWIADKRNEEYIEKLFSLQKMINSLMSKLNI